MKQIEAASTRQIYIWNIVGSLFSALSSMILLAIVTRFASADAGDNFSIAFAIAQLLMTIGIFQVRNYQATDIAEKYAFSDYFLFRVCTSLCMIAAIVVYVLAKGYTGEKAIVVWLICLYKGVEVFSDVFQGLFQQKQRLDMAGKAVSFRIGISTVVFALLMITTGKLVVSCVGLLLSSIVCFFCYDVRKYRLFACLALKRDTQQEIWKRMGRLFVTCLPLFINGYLIMSIYNAPKNAIDDAITNGVLQAGMQRNYNILFMPASVINLFMILLRPLLTTMAIHWGSHKYESFRKTVRTMAGGVLVFMVCVLLGGYLLGIPVLEIVFGTSLEGFRMELMLILLGGGLSSLGTVFDNVITVIRKQHMLVLGYLISWIAAVALADTLVIKWGILGAAVTFLVSMAILFVYALILYLINRGKEGEK